MSIHTLRDQVFDLAREADLAPETEYKRGFTVALDEVMDMILDELWEEGDE